MNNFVHVPRSVKAISSCASAVALVMLVAACAARAADPVVPQGAASAVFGGGCFWCMESDFERLTDQGVLSVTSGYAGGQEQNPTYEQVSAHATGHAEVVNVVYDPKKITYEKLVNYFFRHIDPTQKEAQFCDNGHQYRSVIFYGNEAERVVAEAQREAAKKDLKTAGAIVTEVTKGSTFWPAETYHQDYYKRSPRVYAQYRQGCGRDARVSQVWGTPEGH